MQGLENVDVPGLVIFAVGGGVVGVLRLLTIGWRKRDREAMERLRAMPEPAEPASNAELAIDVTVEPEECSGTRELLEPDYDEITAPVRYTSADLERCRAGLTVRPLPKRISI
jgi:hypothetical protein